MQSLWRSDGCWFRRSPPRPPFSWLNAKLLPKLGSYCLQVPSHSAAIPFLIWRFHIFNCGTGFVWQHCCGMSRPCGDVKKCDNMGR
jgi:hypothetical protein